MLSLTMPGKKRWPFSESVTAGLLVRRTRLGTSNRFFGVYVLSGSAPL